MRPIEGGPYPLVEQPVPVTPREPITGRYLTNRYHGQQPELAFPDAAGGRDWDAWSRALRARLRDVLRLDAWGDVPTPDVHTLEAERCDGYTRRKVAYA